MRISIGLPFCNNRDTLMDAVRSVFAQTLTDWELICVDDGSDDDSVDFLEQINDPRVRVVRDGTRLGLATRLNQVTALARAPFVARMDADDLMHPLRLEKQLAHFLANPEIDVLGTQIYSIDRQRYIRGARGAMPAALTPQHVLQSGILCHPTVMARRIWFEKNPYDESWGRVQDRELWCRTFATTLFDEVREPLLFYREDNDAQGFRKRWRSACAELRIVARHGLTLAGWKASLQMASRSLLKLALNPALHLLGRQSQVFKNRCRELTTAQLAAAQDALEAIQATAVPGWEDPCARSSLPQNSRRIQRAAA